MDLQVILQAISSVGFPIIACFLLFDRMSKSDEKHSEEIKELSSAIQNNTIAMTKLVERLENSG